MRLAPDNKIYLSNAYVDSLMGNYPYTDSMRNMYNENLSVINSPDSLGLACNFTKYSFYLGGKRTYWGLPNNPDYDMGPLISSGCDTINSLVLALPDVKGKLTVFYHLDWQIAFINAQGLKGRNYTLQVYDLMGRKIFSEDGDLSSEYYTKGLNCDQFANGLYVVSLISDKEKLIQKFIKE